MENLSGQPRKIEELMEAYNAIVKELVSMKNFSSIFIHYTVIIDALKELISIRKKSKRECWYCKSKFPLQYWSGWGWFHYVSDGGPDLRCEDEEIQKRPNPEDKEEEKEEEKG